MSPTANELADQKKMVEHQKRETDKMISDQKNLYRSQIEMLDRQIADLRTQRNKAAAELSKLS
jgi:hypothetical protein